VLNHFTTAPYNSLPGFDFRSGLISFTAARLLRQLLDFARNRLAVPAWHQASFSSCENEAWWAKQESNL
jgi:hypothetical protein